MGSLDGATRSDDADVAAEAVPAIPQPGVEGGRVCSSLTSPSIVHPEETVTLLAVGGPDTGVKGAGGAAGGLVATAGGVAVATGPG